MNSLLIFWASILHLTSAQREEVSFSRAWRFHYGPGGDDTTYGPGNNWESAFTPITGCTPDPVLTYPDPHRMTSSDCSTACAYDPVCMAWVHDGFAQSRLCMHAIAGAVCQPSTNNATTVGGQRKAATPLQTSYTFAAASLPEAASWPLVDAPHDALMALNGTFCEACGDARHSYRQRTVAWYRKTFALPSEWAGVGATQVRFEGIMHFAQLWLNGVYLGAHSSTYGEFVVRLDNVSGVVFGGINTLSLRADASYGSEHWYGGGGLFREVQLVHTGPQAWVEQGVWVPPELPLGATSTTGLGEWVNFGGVPTTATFHLALYDMRGVLVANASSAPSLAQPGATAMAHLTLPLPGDLPRWSGSTPALYTAVATLLVSSGSGGGSAAVDSRNFTTGFRATRWDADKGFMLNGEVLKQRGFSHHNSFSGVGVAIPPRLDLFRAQVSRALGANIWRMSHNPYRTSLYDILDALGTLVWDESRDMGPSYQPQQMHDMVKRGRNHVCTVTNSLCNEIECGSVKDVATGVNIVGAAMVNVSKALDPTRPTTANSNSNDGLESVIDVQGFSHASAATFTAAHAAHPLQPLVLSECCSCSTQRSPRSYNYECMVKQNAPGDLPFVAGSLGVWTLFDCECFAQELSPKNFFSLPPSQFPIALKTHTYTHNNTRTDYGEPPDLWPYVSSSFGQLDLAGFPKGHAYWYTANWGNLGGGGGAGSPPTVRILDVLDAPLGTQGGITATTSAASAELLADGVSLGTQPALGAQLFWKLPGAVSVEGGNCSWPVNQTGTQCKGLQAYPSATTAVECKALACSKGLLAWQWGSGSVSFTESGIGAVAAAAAASACWAGTPETDPTTPCPPPTKPTAQWRGESRRGITLPSNATLLARDASGVVVGSHTVLAPSGPPAALTLTLDAPSPATGTGERLVLDGHDCALVRVSVVDKAGVLISVSPVNVTWSVVSGPGRLGGVGSGDPSSHEQPGGTTVATFGGLARAIFITTVDCVSGGRDRVRAVDVEGSEGPTSVLPQDSPCPEDDIVVAADAPGLPRALLHIPVSGDGSVDGVLAVAMASVGGGGGAVKYLGDFVG